MESKTETVSSDNELIAEFYGATRREGKDHFNPDRTIIQLIITGNPYNQHRDNVQHWYSPEQLQYHNSWDWLMPVVEKIENTRVNIENGLGYQFKVNIVDKHAFIESFIRPTGCKKIHLFGEEETKIDSTYKAVVEFIRWYNSQSTEAPKNSRTAFDYLGSVD